MRPGVLHFRVEFTSDSFDILINKLYHLLSITKKEYQLNLTIQTEGGLGIEETKDFRRQSIGQNSNLARQRIGRFSSIWSLQTSYGDLSNHHDRYDSVPSSE